MANFVADLVRSDTKYLASPKPDPIFRIHNTGWEREVVLGHFALLSLREVYRHTCCK
jgi:hypothetical protein